MSVTYTWELPRDSTAAGQARWHVREVSAALVEAIDAELVVTELITNAWKHGQGTDPITLRIEVRDDSMRIEVCGEAASDPVLAQDEVTAQPDGRGLLLIDGLAERWGYERDGRTLCVWAVIPSR